MLALSAILESRKWGFNLSLQPPWFPFPLSIFIAINAILHASKNCYSLQCQKIEGTWIHKLFAFLVLCFGGTTLAALLLGIPSGWISSNDLLPTYILVYILFFHTNNIVFNLTRQFPLFFELLFNLGDGICRSFAITSFGIDSVRLKALPPLSGSIVACIICGTLSGSGGGLINNVFGFTQKNWTFGTPVLLKAPSQAFDYWVSMVASLFYLSLTEASVASGLTQLSGWNVTALDRESGKAVVGLFVVAILLGRVLRIHWKIAMPRSVVENFNSQGETTSASAKIRKRQVKSKKIE